MMSTNTQNRIESRYAGITLEGQPHALTAWFVVALRLLLGGMTLFAGLGKYAFITGEGFNAGGYLANVSAASPVSGLYGAMAANPALVDVINVIIPATQVLIGLALIVGGLLRLAALGGALQTFAFYLGGWEGDILAMFDSTLIYRASKASVPGLTPRQFTGFCSWRWQHSEPEESWARTATSNRSGSATSDSSSSTRSCDTASADAEGGIDRLPRLSPHRSRPRVSASPGVSLGAVKTGWPAGRPPAPRS